MDENFVIQRVFQPLSAFIFDWVGISVQPFALLAVTVIMVVGLTIYVMKNA